MPTATLKLVTLSVLSCADLREVSEQRGGHDIRLAQHPPRHEPYPLQDSRGNISHPACQLKNNRYLRAQICGFHSRLKEDLPLPSENGTPLLLPENGQSQVQKRDLARDLCSKLLDSGLYMIVEFVTQDP